MTRLAKMNVNHMKFNSDILYLPDSLTIAFLQYDSLKSIEYCTSSRLDKRDGKDGIRAMEIL